MATQILDPRDAHTYRIMLTYPDQGITGAAGNVVKEVVALYHQYEDGFITFKDNSGAAAFTVASAYVLEIERLRTHCILAVADDELDMVIAALRELADVSDDAGHMALLADSLERLRPVTADRAAADQSSMPRMSSGA